MMRSWMPEEKWRPVHLDGLEQAINPHPAQFMIMIMYVTM
jgi:hypothetical protein